MLADGEKAMIDHPDGLFMWLSLLDFRDSFIFSPSK